MFKVCKPKYFAFVEFRLRHILVGYPGSVHDAKVFSNSEVAKNPQNYFNLNQWIAGDSAYKLTPFMLTTLRTNSTIGTQCQRGTTGF